jgi:DNA polymerase III delta prime subunit
MSRDSVIGSGIGTFSTGRQVLIGRDKNYKSGFKKPGKDGMGIYRALLVSGPPGIGKTTSAHLMAKEAGYNPIELNASDARSKKLVEVSLLYCNLNQADG